MQQGWNPPSSIERRRFLAALASAPMALRAAQPRLPNIVLIYADDLGYGDVSANGARRVRTPNIDRIAREGVRFTHAHSPSATCTPSRYALLTGEYAWRRPGTAVLPGDARLIIEPGRPTLPSMLKDRGYRTGVVGKWHLGLGAGELDWNDEIRPGPLEIGFDYAFLIPATGDRVPCVYVEDHRVANLDPADPIRVSYTDPFPGEPLGRTHPQLLRMHPSHGHDMAIVNGISRIGYMTGGRKALWKDEDMADVITAKALQFLERHRQEPFFLYFSTHDIHVPRVPHPRFAGRSGMGPRGDAILQLDWCVGEILGALDRHGLARNTLVVFTSDNGPVIDDGYRDEAVEKLGDHRPAGPWRGGKYSNFEGGTRVPFFVRWPESVREDNRWIVESWPRRLEEQYWKDPKVQQEELRHLNKPRLIDGGNVWREEGQDATIIHFWHFLNSIRTRKPYWQNEAAGHHAAACAHMVNESVKTRRMVEWDFARDDIKRG